MDFDSQYLIHKVPSWTEYYFEFQELDYILNKYFNRTNTTNGCHKIENGSIKSRREETEENKENYSVRSVKIDIQDNTQGLKRSYSEMQEHHSLNLEKFKNEFKEKISKVDEFFIGIFNDLVGDYRILRQFFSTHEAAGLNTEINGHNLEQNNVLNRLKSFSTFIPKPSPEKYKLTCRTALFHLYKLIHWLEEYCIVNSIACQKIIESFKEKLNCHNINNNCHHHELIDKHKSMKFTQLILRENELKEKIIKLYADHFCEGNLIKAKEEINKSLEHYEKRINGGRCNVWILTAICVIIFIVYFLLTYIPDKKELADKIDVFFPAFNFTFMTILVFIGFGIDILIFRKYKINYIFLLEINPSTKLRPIQIFTESLILLVIWGCLLLSYRICLTYFYPQLYEKLYVFSVIILGIMIIFYFWPLPSLFFRFRVCMLRIIFNCFFPYGEKAVRFRHFVFGDILTSIIKPIASLTNAFCLFYCAKCRSTNSRLDCTKNSHVTFVLQMIPFLIRMFQCINKFYFTKKLFPHFANTMKYFVAVMMVFTQYMWWLKIFNMWIFITFGIIGYFYMVIWDLHVDWNVIEFKSPNKPIRKNILYPKWVYYYAIVTNIILRVFWVFTVIPIPLTEEINYFVLSFAEIYRRMQWVALRVENEHLSNPEGYRIHLEVPELPIKFINFRD